MVDTVSDVFEYILRESWGAPAPKRALQAMPGSIVSDVFLHHTVTSVTSDPRADMRRVTDYGEYSDVPYTDLVHPLGVALQGRYLNGRPALGAHTSKNNSTSLGVAAIGNYVGEIPNALMIEAIARVIERWVRNGWLTPIFRLRSHSEVYQTACCGVKLREQIAHIYGVTQGLLSGVVVPPAPITVPQPTQPPLTSAPSFPVLLVRTNSTASNVYVKQLQRQLNKVGNYLLVEDGLFGARTQAAVISYQKTAFTDPNEWDGMVGKKTWNKLFGATAKPLFVAFPLPPGHYYGVYNAEDDNNHSGKNNERDRSGIRLIQQKLGLVADGGFGPNTRNAVINFQRTHGLASDGLAGAKTWSKLFS